MSGYTRQSAASIATGNTVEAAPINAEFNALQSAFNGTTGHAHDGTTGNSPKINLTSSVTAILPVANGGTGVASLTSNSVLVGAGTSAVDLSKAAPTGDFIGTTDTQTLSNKTLGTTNTITLKDNLFTIVGSVDATKAIHFEVDGLTTGTTRTVTIPDANFTMVGVDTTQTLTNKTLTAPTLNNAVGDFTGPVATTDANFYILDNLDNTKIVKFELNGLTTGTTRTLTVPDANLTLVGLNTTQTLTNKTLTSPTITGASMSSVNITSGTITGITDLAVADGGTGVSTLTSGNVLVGNGTGAVQTTKAAPSGDFVGTSDSQTLTNKTLTSPTVNNGVFNAYNGGGVAGFRNKIINGDFYFAQRGASFTNIGGYTLDRWSRIRDDTSATVVVSRQAHTVGQTSVPGNPKYFLRVNQSVAGSGATANYILQRIEGVETLADKQVTFTAYMNPSSGITVPAIAFLQVFGTGGTPSATVTTNMGVNINLSAGWQKVQYNVTLPSVSGKTLGTNGDDYLALYFELPVNQVFQVDISHVSVVEGNATNEVDPFSPRHLAIETQLCQRYYQFVSCEYSGDSTSTGSPSYTANVMFPVPMRAAPTATVSSSNNNAAFSGNATVSEVTISYIRALNTCILTASGGRWRTDYYLNAEL